MLPLFLSLSLDLSEELLLCFPSRILVNKDATKEDENNNNTTTIVTRR